MHNRTLGSGALRSRDARDLREAIARCSGLGPLLARLARTSPALRLREVPLGALIDAVAEALPPRRHLRVLPSSQTIATASRAQLSARELDVIRLIARGLSNKGIGESLGLSDKTIKNHISHILRKLGLRARTQVAILALRSGLD